MQFVSENGVNVMNGESITISVTDNAEVIGFGSANPSNEEPFTKLTHTAFNGRALAAIMGKTVGIATITVTTKKQIIKKQITIK